MPEVCSSVQMFYKNKVEAARIKDFRTQVNLKAITLKVLKVELLFMYKEKCRLKSLNLRFFKNNFTRTQEPVFLIYYLSLFITWHFYVWNLFGKQFFT